MSVDLLKKEYAIYRRNQNIYRNLVKQFCQTFDNNKCKYEIKNILERFTLSISNLKKGGDWDLKTLTKDHPVVQKMIDELTDKKRYYKLKDADRKKITQIVMKELKNEEKIEGETAKLSNLIFDFDNYELRFKIGTGMIKVNVSRRNLGQLQKGLEKGDWKETHIAIMVLRYLTHFMGSQQWGIPLPVFMDLYHQFGARYEAFASPLNSRFLGMKDAKFGSLFRDTDEIFGSIGNFFETDILNLAKENTSASTSTSGDTVWVINPPYIETLLELSVIKMDESLSNWIKINRNSKEKGDLTFFGVMPEWSDSKAFQMVEKSPHLKYMEILHPDDHYYTDVQGRKIKARFGSMVYVLSSGGEADYQSAFDKFFLD